jgi:hypothetical protein
MNSNYKIISISIAWLLLVVSIIYYIMDLTGVYSGSSSGTIFGFSINFIFIIAALVMLIVLKALYRSPKK